MKRLLVMLVAVGLLLVPLSAAVYAQQSSSGSRPPIEPPLVREGEFAVQLARSFNLPDVVGEPETESALASLGIAPRNGWISNYPVTPDIIAEVQKSAADAADSGSLPMTREAAVDAVQRVGVDAGLLISTAEGPNEGAGRVPPSESPAAIETYYYDSGPPVVTYYPPPWDYGYLYSWVPYPFWWGPWCCGGFFILSDFDVVITDRHHHHHCRERVSNHVTNSAGRVTRIDPVGRFAAGIGAGTPQSRLAALRTADPQQSGRSIMNRDLARSRQNSSAPASANNGPNGTRIPQSASRYPASRSVSEYRTPPPPRSANINGETARPAARRYVEYPRTYSQPTAPRGVSSSGGFQGGYHGGTLVHGGYNGTYGGGGGITSGSGMSAGGGGFHH